MVDMNGDGRSDMIEGLADGTVLISLGLGERQYELTQQELPKAFIADVVAGDLNGDSYTDLYLVTPDANVGLVGDGSGLFAIATHELGLRDEGLGQSAILRDLDDDGAADLLLFNLDGDVLFWGVPGGFERDARTPFVPASVVRAPVSGEPTIPTSRLVNQDSENATSSTHIIPPSGTDDFVSTRRPVAVDPTGPRVHPFGDANSKSPTPIAAIITPVAPPLTPGPVRLVPKLQVGLTLQQQQILGLLSVVDLPDGIGGMVQTLRVTGANFQVVNGIGVTDSLNGLGNLIVGYNELRTGLGSLNNRTGSHNIVGGNQNNFTDAGGHIVGNENSISSEWASVSGGRLNTASGYVSSISGGYENTASGFHSSVSGGRYNTANGNFSSVSGGGLNVTSGLVSSISGGRYNTASGNFSSVSAGVFNVASGLDSSISGGQTNEASSSNSSVSGGRSNVADGTSSSISGGYYNTASGTRSSISGGYFNSTVGNASTVTGGRFNTAFSSNSSVSGGQFQKVFGIGDWRAGSYFYDY